MKKIILSLGFALVAFLFAACEKVVDFDIEDMNPYVVVQSKPEADSAMNVTLSYSRFFLDGHSFHYIDDASVRLIQNGVEQSAGMNAGNGVYNFGIKPQPGDTLSLIVDVPGRETVTAGTRIPNPPSYEVVEFLVDTSDYYSYQDFFRVKVRINDPSEMNFYKLSVDGWTYSQTYDYETETYIDTFLACRLWLRSEDIVFTDATSLEFALNEGDIEVYGEELSFTDEIFNGQPHTITFAFTIWRDEHSPNYQQLPFYLNLTSVSEDLYRYQSSLESSDNDIPVLSEPTQIYTNIQGGIGIFGASTTSATKIHPTIQHFQHDSYYYKGKKK